MTRLHVLLFSLTALALCGAGGTFVLLLDLPGWPALALTYLAGIALAFPLSRGIEAAVAAADQPGQIAAASFRPASQGQEMGHRGFEFPRFVRM